ncbi:glucose-1-phosphate thymidylyltransferase, partial [bacterium]|nr:glucose-1-phosphate thymidylyltransferase [bacterium]
IWSMEMSAPEIELIEAKDTLVFWPWELLKRQRAAIEEDFRGRGVGQVNGDVDARAILVEETNMHIAAGAKVRAGAILDASDGPILLEDGVEVMPGAVLLGPIAVGEKTKINPGAKIHGPCSIGPVCKIGGEVEDTIIQGFSNKQHEGFLGHALLGEWVNLGADTNNSDLKNNYSAVSVVLEGESINTGETFFGSIIGDHVKTAINTQLNTGTVIGIGTNIFGAGFPPKAIGDFRWGGVEGFVSYDYEKFMGAARAAMKRRGLAPSSAMATLLRSLHKESISEM